MGQNNKNDCHHVFQISKLQMFIIWHTFFAEKFHCNKTTYEYNHNQTHIFSGWYNMSDSASHSNSSMEYNGL